MRTGLAIAFSLSLTGCALVFRGDREKVLVESTPSGAEATSGPRKVGTTPTQFDVPRRGKTPITLAKAGYEDNTGLVKKHINGGWLTVDILTCAFPILLCIPIILDAASGAWYDVEDRYIRELKAGSSERLAASGDAPPVRVETTPPPSGAGMSDSDRKATARAAFQEGVTLQEQKNCADALPKFQTAEKLYPAPTNQLRIAECQAATGKLVEANETYESLTHLSIDKSAPDAFRQAQDQGKKELAALAPRIPTLRIATTPAASSLSQLIVRVNGNAVPNETLGIARPVNPGHYHVTAWAAGYKEAASDVDVPEATPKAVELRMQK